jgi:hypothetical protein
MLVMQRENCHKYALIVVDGDVLFLFIYLLKLTGTCSSTRGTRLFLLTVASVREAASSVLPLTVYLPTLSSSLFLSMIQKYYMLT